MSRVIVKNDDSSANADVMRRPGENAAPWQERAHEAIPGGCHTAAKGDDQYPINAPAFIARGLGSHIWDVDDREYIEYAQGLRSTTLGHCYPSVIKAAGEALHVGNNFNRPHTLEVECAEMFLQLIPTADMVKFTKDGSTVMTTAVKVARAVTGRSHIALCSDSPFFSYDDWFMGKTAIDTGIPDATKQLSLPFHYNDIESLKSLFADYPDKISCVVMEPSRLVEPEPGFLQDIRALCDKHGAVLVFDETLTGFRVHKHGAQHVYGVTPDLSCFGKAMANGFAVSALAGKREVMELGGLRQTSADRVFMLSTTHGAESIALAAATECMRIYRDEPVIEHLYARGAQLREGFEREARLAGVAEHCTIAGRDCNLMFATRDSQHQPSQPLRTLFLQELCAAGVLAPTFYTSYSHSIADIDTTLSALKTAFATYRKALDEGVEHYLNGPASQSVYRKRN